MSSSFLLRRTFSGSLNSDAFVVEIYDFFEGMVKVFVVDFEVADDVDVLGAVGNDFGLNLLLIQEFVFGTRLISSKVLLYF